MTRRKNLPNAGKDGSRRPPKGGQTPSGFDAVAAARKALGLEDSLAEQAVKVSAELVILRNTLDGLVAAGAAPEVIAAIRREIPKLERKRDGLRLLRGKDRYLKQKRVDNE